MTRAWTVGKLLYLYLQYWLLGLEDTGFQLTKGGYLYDLGHYSAAARAYQRALRETQAPLVHAALGYCYLNMGLHDKAIGCLELAYSRKADPEAGVALAHAHLENGNTESGRKVYEGLIARSDTYEPRLQSELKRIGALLDASD